jgi:hypothetical protein
MWVLGAAGTCGHGGWLAHVGMEVGACGHRGWLAHVAMGDG